MQGVTHLARSASSNSVTGSHTVIRVSARSAHNTNNRVIGVFHTITSNNSENSMFCVLFLLKSVVKIEIMVNLKFIF